jgi:hypothetical protein
MESLRVNETFDDYLVLGGLTVNDLDAGGQRECRSQSLLQSRDCDPSRGP